MARAYFAFFFKWDAFSPDYARFRRKQGPGTFNPGVAFTGIITVPRCNR